jgi:hypothetical protein
VQPPYRCLYITRQAANAAHLVYLPGAGLLLQLLHLHISPHPRLSHCDPDDLTRWDSAAGRPRNGCAGREERQAGLWKLAHHRPPPIFTCPLPTSTSALRSPHRPANRQAERKRRQEDRIAGRLLPLGDRKWPPSSRTSWLQSPQRPAQSLTFSRQLFLWSDPPSFYPLWLSV